MTDTSLAPGRRLREPLFVLAAAVVVTVGIWLAGSLVALVAFAALAAIVCRRAQLWLEARGVRGWLALVTTIAGFCGILIVLVLAAVASAGAVAVQMAGESDRMRDWIAELEAAWASVTGVPASTLPAIDPSALIAFARSVVSALTPVITTLAMAVLIVIYLLIDADRLRGRMLRATSAASMARYDALATELVTYVRVRAVLGGAAAIADTVLLLVLGVPYAVLWGIVSFLFSFVPNIGFVVALVPPAVFALMEHGLGSAIAVVVGYVVINLTFDYVLQPRMMATSLDLSPVVVITTIIVWTVLIGPAGALLAVPLTIALRAILRPFPEARWFLALLGPAPGESRPTAPRVTEPVPADPAQVTADPASPAADPASPTPDPGS